jgi:hypothetical protein
MFSYKKFEKYYQTIETYHGLLKQLEPLTGEPYDHCVLGELFDKIVKQFAPFPLSDISIDLIYDYLFGDRWEGVDTLLDLYYQVYHYSLYNILKEKLDFIIPLDLFEHEAYSHYASSLEEFPEDYPYIGENSQEYETIAEQLTQYVRDTYQIDKFVVFWDNEKFWLPGFEESLCEQCYRMEEFLNN